VVPWRIALARAAAKAGIPFTLASTSNTAMETVLEEGGGRQWVSVLCLARSRNVDEIALRAREAGFEGWC